MFPERSPFPDATSSFGHPHPARPDALSSPAFLRRSRDAPSRNTGFGLHHNPNFGHRPLARNPRSRDPDSIPAKNPPKMFERPCAKHPLNCENANPSAMWKPAENRPPSGVCPNSTASMFQVRAKPSPASPRTTPSAPTVQKSRQGVFRVPRSAPEVEDRRNPRRVRPRDRPDVSQ